MYLMLHEIGHALGLKHAKDDGFVPGEADLRDSFAQLGIADKDNVQYMVMSSASRATRRSRPRRASAFPSCSAST
jgi:hypothetical protein